MIGVEDCLVVNVYTTNLPKTGDAKKLGKPVMVWIHGGGLTAGDGTKAFYGPDLFMDHDVVSLMLHLYILISVDKERFNVLP